MKPKLEEEKEVSDRHQVIQQNQTTSTADTPATQTEPRSRQQSLTNSVSTQQSNHKNSAQKHLTPLNVNETRRNRLKTKRIWDQNYQLTHIRQD